MSRLKKGLALVLTLCMMLSLMPVITPSAKATANNDDFYKIVHVDAGRKYFSPENIKKIIDNAAAAGFNQVELYLSDNQGFRFALDDMTITTSYGTYDLTPALGDGYSDGSKYPDGSGKYLTQSEMTDIISYAGDKGIDIVPCINVPGHMGAILEEFTSFRYTSGSQTSKSSIDLANEEAVAFALAITQKYAAYFASQGVEYYNIGADEYANDLSSMGFEGMGSALYTKFVEFLNSAAEIIIDAGMTPRAFNDGFYYTDYNISVTPNAAYQICYWSSGWSGYDVASAATLSSKGFDMINTHGDYYWVLGNSSWQCSASKASGFDYTSFQGGTISDPAGAMFCIWCDVGNANGTDDGAAVVSATADVIAAFGATLPASETTDPEPEESASTVYNDDSTVSVTAPGLTSLNVTKGDVTQKDGVTVVRYSITPRVNETDYTEGGTVTIRVPDELKNFASIKVFDVAKNQYVDSTVSENDITFTTTHFSDFDIEGRSIDVTENETITVTVGGTETDTISGANYAGTYTTEDPSIATVEVTGTDATEATTTYTQASVTCNTLISSNSNNWTAVSGYYYTPDGTNYYPVYAKRSSSWSWSSWTTIYTYTWGYSTASSTSNVTQIGTQETDSTSTTPNITVYTKSGTDGTPASTTVTFTGVAVGTTYVTVGNTRYTINVVAEDLSKVTPLTVEYWITNQQVNANGAISMTIAANDSGVYSESGALFSALVPATGTQNNNPMVFWKGTRLASDNKQTTGGGVDKTKSGTDFTYIRYWEGSWAYSSDGENWINVVSGDQIVAYYLQKTEVTDEITTLVSDYGNVPGYGSSLSPFVMVDYAVKYESGELTPSSFPTAKTIAFHCNYNSTADLGNTVIKDGTTYYRKLGTIKAVETADYEVYMITLTPTSDTKTETVANNATGATSYKYNGTEKVVWVDDEANLGDFADESLHYTSPSGTITYTVGGAPNINGLEIYKNQCMLVTYYVRAKVTEDSLAVHYIDQTANSEFYSYNIAVKSGTLFNENIGLSNPWKGPLANGSVTNLQDKTQTVSADLSTMPAIGAQYRYSDYTCVNVVRSEDGKDVYLYYTFDNAKNFVIDFGLPLKITADALGISSASTSASVSGAKYGTATASANGELTYTPTKTLPGIETLNLTLTDSTGSVTHTIYIYPATTVYYEEGFASYSGNGWTSTASKGTGTQTASLAGNSNEYGYDAKYAAEDTGPSNGTQATSTAAGDAATFAFTGTGVDIYANCTSDSGAVMIKVKNNSTGNTVKAVRVLTALQNGKTDATDNQETTGYNVPIASITDLPHGSYTVEITHIKTSSTESEVKTVNLDGFRVYGTLENQSNEVYTKDLEDDPIFIELRDQVLASVNAAAGNGTVTSDNPLYAKQIAQNTFSQIYSSEGSTSGAIIVTNANAGYTSDDLTDLLNNGPKNEIYLQPGQALIFTVSTPREVQIGLKALNAETTYTITGKEDSQTLKSSTDMFYTVLNKGSSSDQTITITNKGDGILSITKLKICDDPNATLGTLTADDLIPALVDLGIVEAAEESGGSGSSGGSAGGIGGGGAAPAEPSEPTTPPAEDEGQPAEDGSLPFADVTAGDWFRDSVKYVYEKGLMNGTSETTFSPLQTTNRAMIVTILHRLENSPAPDGQAPFADVPAGEYYANPVAWAAANGIVTGTSETTFSPLNNITREQLAVILYRYAQYKGYDVSVGEDTNILSFTDAETISEYAIPAIQWAVGAGLINGKGDGRLDPQGSATRAEVSAILARFCEAYAG